MKRLKRWYSLDGDGESTFCFLIRSLLLSLHSSHLTSNIYAPLELTTKVLLLALLVCVCVHLIIHKKWVLLAGVWETVLDWITKFWMFISPYSSLLLVVVRLHCNFKRTIMPHDRIVVLSAKHAKRSFWQQDLRFVMPFQIYNG